MAKLPRPTKPLKILTIDGGGLQGISSLLILDKLLNAIAPSNQDLDSRPRPCDVFDVIAGIGSGGWLALLLGRFQMDVSAALAEWYNLIDCITPKSKVEEIRMRLVEHSYFHPDRLVEQIDQLADFYETDKHMFFTPPDGTRCKHVFVSALKTDSKGRNLGYHLFRTYDCPQDVKVLSGPPDPRKYKISHAFGVTGAAKYFTPPWKETSAKKVKSKFQDIQFPSPHNITELALDEMWGLYGTDVEISVVVNIGPGIPNASDCKQIARRFSWDRKVATTSHALPKERSSDVGGVTTHSKRGGFRDRKATDEGVHFDQHSSNLPGSTDGKTFIVARHRTFGSEQEVGIEDKLSRDEKRIEVDIRRKLQNIYKENTPPYYRLAPDMSAPRTAKNDTSSPKVAFDATTQYLHISRVEDDMEQVGRRVLLEIPVIAG